MYILSHLVKLDEDHQIYELIIVKKKIPIIYNCAEIIVPGGGRAGYAEQLLFGLLS